MLVCYLSFHKPIATFSTLYRNSRGFEHYYCNTRYFKRVSLNFGELKVISKNGFYYILIMELLLPLRSKIQNLDLTPCF